MKLRRKSLILGIILLLCGLGIGYSFLTTTLSINGTADVDANTWNIYWDNVQVKTGSVSGTQVTTAPTIDTNKTTVSFQVNLKQPGEYYEFTVDAKNDGSIDAMVDTITTPESIPSYLDYTVSYFDGFPIAKYHLLASGEKAVYRVRVEYRTDIEASDLPDTADSVPLEFSVTYVQADSNAIALSREVFDVSNIRFTIGENIPDGVTTFDSYQNATASFGRNIFLKHIVSHNVVTESYIGIVMNDQVYYLRGGGATYNSSTNSYNNDSPYYTSNAATLQTAFAGGTCDENSDYYSCYLTSMEIYAYVSKNGYISVDIGDPACEGSTCFIEESGVSRCY